MYKLQKLVIIPPSAALHGAGREICCTTVYCMIINIIYK